MHHLAAIKPTEHVKFRFYDQQAFKQVATLLYVTSDVSDELLHTLANIVKSCICFIVTKEPPVQSKLTTRYKHMQIIYVDPTDFYQLFTEVMKP